MRHTSRVISRMMIVVMLFVFIQSGTLNVYADEFDNEPTVIRFSHTVSNEMPRGQMALKFKSLVEERMPGKYVVEVYPNAEMFGDEQIFEALLLDDVQMGVPDFAWYGRYTKKLQLFDLPFLFKDMQAIEKFQETAEGQDLMTSFRDRGLLGLGYVLSGFKQMSATKKIVLPADVKGLKFRIMSSDVLEAQFKAVGAEAVKKPFSQVYSLLAGGVVDGQENAWMYIYSQKFYKVQPYITETNHGILGAMVVTSINFWDSLPGNDQKVLKVALGEAITYGNDLSVVNAKAARQKIIDSNQSEVIQLTDAQRSKWVESMRPVWKQFEGEIGADLIDKAYKVSQE
ncbi:MAG: DctP family TRAP transporter solute-binding subunit [Desulfotalea sp.]